MNPRRRQRETKQNNQDKFIITAFAIIAVIVIVISLLCNSCQKQEPTPELDNPPVVTNPTDVQQDPENTTPEDPAQVVSTATIGAMGDLLMHKPIFDDVAQYDAAVQQADGSYDFSSLFEHLDDYTSALDYAAVNLETTLCSTENGYGYSGYPHFNCPDSIVDGAKNAGFDMLLTANNHSYDTSLVGYLRTLDVVRNAGLETLGTYKSADEQKWTIVDVNGIKVGMLCYTWAAYATDDGRPSLNYNNPIEKSGLCNYFTGDNLPKFYAEVEDYMKQMEQAGAEATMMFIHWGVEYVLAPNAEQEAIAQKLCDAGIDVIVGGHPHVVQPVDLLESTVDPEHKTVCLYSTGNAVSNQRLGNISSINTAHTEDGILFTVTFEKYSDGSVHVANADAIPTWVNLHKNAQGKDVYNILPLDYDRVNEWKTMFNLGDSTYHAAKDSYDRTMALVGSGLQEANTYYTQQKEAREAS